MRRSETQARPLGGLRVARLGEVLAGLLCALGLSTVSCTLTLNDDIACGDGFVDEIAGEQCDPGVPSSYINACVGTSRPDGRGDCDPVTCEIINDLEQCAICGDDRVDEIIGEQCDGQNLNGRTCLGAVGILQCTTDCQYDESECEDCGNGSIEPGEECDPNMDPDGLTMGKPQCHELTSPFSAKPYTAGTPGNCRSDCTWERAGCNYCGNGQVEDATPLDTEGSIVTLPEWCDGFDFDRGILDRELAGSACTQNNPDTRPIVQCADDCLDFIEVDAEPSCCLRSGAACPALGQLRCCYELEQLESADGPCAVVVQPDGNFTEVCR